MEVGSLKILLASWGSRIGFKMMFKMCPDDLKEKCSISMSLKHF